MSRVLPILFNTDMVRAILDGRKTVTRRIMKLPKHIKQQEDGLYTLFADGTCYENQSMEEIEGYLKPPYQPGDILYVRETWGVMRAKRFDACVDITFKGGGKNKRIFFPNGGTDSANRDEYDEFIKKWAKASTLSWHPSIHMPKQAARIWLKVTDVRVERLQDITNEQILKEGIGRDTVVHYLSQFPENTEEWERAAHLIPFVELWNSTVKKKDVGVYDWYANPYVFVIEFEQCEKSEGIYFLLEESGYIVP